jgi:GT2 family glycosyltransferase
VSVRHVAGAAGAPDGCYDADVVILSLDRVEQTEAAIRSAIAQVNVSRHVFIVDQGSRPEALARLASVVAERTDATLVALDHNLGVAGGRNRGTDLGHGRVVVGLDNDAEFADANTLAQAVLALASQPTLAAIGFRIVLHATGADDRSSWGYPVSLRRHAAATFDAVTFVGAGHAIRRAAWEACGGYDEVLFFCWEEFDFSLRAIASGWRIGDITVRHKVSPEQRCTWSGTRWFYFVRNRLYIARKWGRSWPALAPRIAGYLLRGARNGELPQTLRALRAAIRLSSGVEPRHMSSDARAYLRAADAVHRGSLLLRLRHEVLALLPAPHRCTPPSQLSPFQAGKGR